MYFPAVGAVNAFDAKLLATSKRSVPRTTVTQLSIAMSDWVAEGTA